MKTALVNFWKEEDGQDLVEYSLLLAFIALAAVALLGGVQGSIKNMWSNINSTMVSASTTTKN